METKFTFECINGHKSWIKVYGKADIVSAGYCSKCGRKNHLIRKEIKNNNKIITIDY